jgi:hypothetical protein
VPAVTGYKMPVKLKIKQRAQVSVGFEDDIAAPSSIASVFYTLTGIFIPVNALATFPPGTAFYVYFNAVNEHECYIIYNVGWLNIGEVETSPTNNENRYNETLINLVSS